MTDDLNHPWLVDLRAALKVTPAPDGKAQAMALAMENFDRLQESTDLARSSEDRPEAAPLNGVRRMFRYLTSRPALAATTSVAALVVGIAVIQPFGSRGSGPGSTTERPESITSDQTEVAEIAPTTVATAEAPQPVPTLEPEVVVEDPIVVVEDPVVAVEPTINEEAGTALDLTGYLDTPVAPATPQAEAVAEAEPVIEGNIADDVTSTSAQTERSQNKSRIAVEAEAGLEFGLAELSNDSEVAVDGNMAGITEVRDLSEDAAEEVSSVFPDPADETVVENLLPPVENTEEYSNEPPNPVKVTAEEPVSTFSIDVDTASYAVIRSSLTGGYLPTPDQVRIEEMVNYFPYVYKAPTAEEAFSSTVSVMPTPWNPGTRLVTIGIQGALPQVEARAPLNLVFLIDTSGSMEDANKLPLLKQSLSLMLAELRPEDQVSIVTYAGSAGLVLPPTAAGERAAILASLENLAAGGSTAGAEGLELAYQVAEGMKTDGEVSRILLATDGDFNVGIDDPEGLEAYVARKRETGTYLSVLGFGRGNLDDAVMQSLAQNGNGTAAYIDTLSEARKVLVDQLTGALFPIADDVKIQVEWNPATVAEYRLIGYETRALRREDFNNDKVDAGEIGAGTQVTAIYEVTAPGSDAVLNDPLRYRQTESQSTAGELGFLRLRWKAPGAETSTLIETPITGEEGATTDARFAAAIAGFGQLLQNSVYTGDWGWDQAIELALSNRGDDPFGYRTEAVNLMRLAQSLNQ